MSSCIYLVDATALCYRAFYALKGLATSYGQDTNAVYGFVSILQKILKRYEPHYMAACFDVSRDTFRSKKFAQYKIQRAPMPEGLASQIPLIKEVAAAYGVAVVQKEGFEADDLIATLARMAGEADADTLIVSSDKDILQLVGPRCKVFNPGKDGGVELDEEGVRDRMGVPPAAVVDLLGLMGDAVDNIPGVPGVGEKTAVQLLKEFGSVPALLEDTGRIKQEKLRQSVASHKDSILLSRSLAQLDDRVPLDISIEDLRIKPQDTRELFRIFSTLEFKSLVKGLEVADEKPAGDEPAAQTLPDDDFPEVDELVLAGTGAHDLVFSCAGRVFRAEALGPRCRKALADPGVLKSGHDLKRLCVSLAREGIAMAGFSFDTMIAAYVLNPSRNAATLEELAWEYLKRTIPQDSLSPEAGAGLIAGLRPAMEPLLKEQGLEKLFTGVEMPLAQVLAQMESDGIRLDLPLLSSLSGELEQKLTGIVDEIYRICGCQFNLNSPKQLREVLFEKLKLPVVKRTKTGPSTDEEVLHALASQHALPKLLLEYRQLTKLKNTYIDTLPQMVDQKDGRVHTTFNQTGTETGRLSSSNPNLQNIPVKTEVGGKIRKAVIPFGEGDWLVACDYSQVELRILAHLSGDEILAQAFKEDKDIHKATAALIFGVEEKDVDEKMRSIAKRVNFGIVYGQSAFGLAKDLEIPVAEAGAFIDAYFSRYPRVQEYIQAQIAKAKKDGFVTTILGRRRYLPEINNKNMGIRQFAERQAANTPIQGSASDLIKCAMIEIQKQIAGRKASSRMLVQIHDELLFNVPERELKDFMPMVRKTMEHVMEISVPLLVTVQKGKNWLEMEDAS